MTAREAAIATVAYIALTVLMTWPLGAHLGDSVPWYNDTFIFVWDLAHTRHALLDPTRSVFETRDVFWPEGISLAYHTLAPLYGPVAVVLVPLCGLITSFNLLVLLTFVTSALSAHALARWLTGSTGGGFVAGCLFAFSPYHQAHGPHLNLLSIQFLPITAWAALRFASTGSRRHALALAASGVLSLYTCHEYGLFAAILAVTLVVPTLLKSGVRARPADLIGRGLFAIALSALLALPLILPMIAEAVNEAHYVEAVDIDFAADLVAWITPSVRHSLWGGYTMKVYQHFPGVLAEWTTYIGVIAATLALTALVRRRSEAWPWLFVAMVFGVFALGPRLRILGTATSIPLPYALLDALPMIGALREPSRFASVVTLAVAVLGAYGFDALRSNRRGYLAWFAIPLLLLDFVQIPMPLSPVATPSFLTTLAADSDDYAIIDVPSGLEIREHLYHQAIHQRAILLGYIARIPEASRRFITTTPIVTDPATWDLTAADANSERRARGFARFAREVDARYALVHREFYVRRGQPERFDQAVANLRRLPGARVVAEEAGFVAVRIDGR